MELPELACFREQRRRLRTAKLECTTDSAQPASCSASETPLEQRQPGDVGPKTGVCRSVQSKPKLDRGRAHHGSAADVTNDIGHRPVQPCRVVSALAVAVHHAVQLTTTAIEKSFRSPIQLMINSELGAGLRSCLHAANEWFLPHERRSVPKATGTADFGSGLALPRFRREMGSAGQPAKSPVEGLLLFYRANPGRLRLLAGLMAGNHYGTAVQSLQDGGRGLLCGLLCSMEVSIG